MFCGPGVFGSERDLDVCALLEANVIAMFVDQSVFDAQITMELIGGVQNNVGLFRLAGPRRSDNSVDNSGHGGAEPVGNSGRIELQFGDSRGPGDAWLGHFFLDVFPGGIHTSLVRRGNKPESIAYLKKRQAHGRNLADLCALEEPTETPAVRLRSYASLRTGIGSFSQLYNSELFCHETMSEEAITNGKTVQNSGWYHALEHNA